jgi:hypothetical protein
MSLPVRYRLSTLLLAITGLSVILGLARFSVASAVALYLITALVVWYCILVEIAFRLAMPRRKSDSIRTRKDK